MPTRPSAAPSNWLVVTAMIVATQLGFRGIGYLSHPEGYHWDPDHGPATVLLLSGVHGLLAVASAMLPRAVRRLVDLIWMARGWVMRRIRRIVHQLRRPGKTRALAVVSRARVVHQWRHIGRPQWRGPPLVRCVTA